MFYVVSLNESKPSLGNRKRLPESFLEASDKLIILIDESCSPRIVTQVPERYGRGNSPAQTIPRNAFFVVS